MTEKAVIYARLSPDGSKVKEEVEDHLDDQIEDTKNLLYNPDSPLHDRDVKVVNTFRDGDTSGRKKMPVERDGFVNMLEYMLDNPDVNIILVKKANRLTRQPGHAFDPWSNIYNMLWTPDNGKRDELEIFQERGLRVKDEDTKIEDVNNPGTTAESMDRFIQAWSDWEQKS